MTLACFWSKTVAWCLPETVLVREVFLNVYTYIFVAGHLTCLLAALRKLMHCLYCVYIGINSFHRCTVFVKSILASLVIPLPSMRPVQPCAHSFGKHDSSTAYSDAEDVREPFSLDVTKRFLCDENGVVKPVLFFSVDGGPDESPRCREVRFSVISLCFSHHCRCARGLFMDLIPKVNEPV